MGPLKFVDITASLKIALFAKICACFPSNSISRVTGVDVNKDVWAMYHQSGIWSGKTLKTWKTLTALFFTRCRFKYFDFLEKSNSQTVTNEFLTDWNAIFMKKISKLYYRAILSSANWRLLVVLHWNFPMTFQRYF